MAFLLSHQNVFEYLTERCICSQEEQAQGEVERKFTKNFNLLVTLPKGRQLLVKQERHNREGKTATEFWHEWQIQEFLQRFPEVSQIRSWVSEVIYFDAENSILVFNYLNDYRDLMDFYTKDNVLATALAQQDEVISIGSTIGAALATIHRLTLDHQEYREFFRESRQGVAIDPTLHLVSQLERIGPEIFGQVPADALKFFALYQRYDSLKQAIAELTTAFEPCCLAHNDLKLNNILLSTDWQLTSLSETSNNSMVRLIDWERSTWGDPAFDLGMLIASYLQIWLSNLMTSKAIAIEESLRMAMTPLEHLQPSLAAIAIAYFAHFPQVLERRPNFLRRVVQFSGLALILQILSMIEYQKTFGNQGICMLQVAKTLLGRPEQSIATIFGKPASELTLSCSPA
jgi:thiamine kinase-like enzyme